MIQNLLKEIELDLIVTNNPNDGVLKAFISHYVSKRLEEANLSNIKLRNFDLALFAQNLRKKFGSILPLTGSQTPLIIFRDNQTRYVGVKLNKLAEKHDHFSESKNEKRRSRRSRRRQKAKEPTPEKPNEIGWKIRKQQSALEQINKIELRWELLAVRQMKQQAQQKNKQLEKVIQDLRRKAKQMENEPYQKVIKVDQCSEFALNKFKQLAIKFLGCLLQRISNTHSIQTTSDFSQLMAFVTSESFLLGIRSELNVDCIEQISAILCQLKGFTSKQDRLSYYKLFHYEELLICIAEELELTEEADFISIIKEIRIDQRKIIRIIEE